jgi:GrpB-like predicted nucleotidyltransferase (UPF0157 family)
VGSDAGRFERHPELRRLSEALASVAVRLEHVGSTAVPGLAAKPILDLQLSVAAIEHEFRHHIEAKDEYVRELEARVVKWARGT